MTDPRIATPEPEFVSVETGAKAPVFIILAAKSWMARRQPMALVTLGTEGGDPIRVLSP